MSGPVKSADEHDEIQERLSDYYEGLLADDRAASVRAHLEQCEVCERAYRELESAVGAVSELHRMAAPQRFEDGVEATIHRRSAGRFFGRRAFGDRVPLEIVAVVALVLGLVLYGIIRASGTGTLGSPEGDRREQVAPGAEEAIPKP